MSAWNARRYSPWLLKHEERLRERQTSLSRMVLALALLIALVEALLPWDMLTPGIPHWLHIGMAAIALPLLHLLNQADRQRKEQGFTLALSDKGRRLLFLDPYLEPEEFALSEHISGAHLLPLQRQIEQSLKLGSSPSLTRRLDLYYRTLPSPIHEGDRLGLLSILHPTTFVTWALAIALVWLALPGVGLAIGAGRGLTVLPLLLPLFLYSARANTRFAYETALYDWLRGM